MSTKALIQFIDHDNNVHAEILKLTDGYPFTPGGADGMINDIDNFFFYINKIGFFGHNPDILAIEFLRWVPNYTNYIICNRGFVDYNYVYRILPPRGDQGYSVACLDSDGAQVYPQLHIHPSAFHHGSLYFVGNRVARLKEGLYNSNGGIVGGLFSVHKTPCFYASINEIYLATEKDVEGYLIDSD